MPLACARVYGGAIALIVGGSGGWVILRLRACIESKIEWTQNGKVCISDNLMQCIINERTALLESYLVTNRQS
jgi:hypothetical protein